MDWHGLLKIFSPNSLYMEALEDCKTMMNMASSMYHKSIETLRRNEVNDVDFDFNAYDKDVNRLQREVRKKIFTHLSIAGSDHLQSGLVLSHVADFTEQIGDRAKNIHELAKTYTKRLTAGDLEAQLKEIESEVTRVFSEALLAFDAGDDAKARQIMVAYKNGLAERCNQFIIKFLQGKAIGFDTPSTAALVLYVRFLKSIASISKDIATCIVNPFHRIGYKEKLDE